MSPNHFQGKPCKYGHKGIRYKSTKACVDCAKLKQPSRRDYNRKYNKGRNSSPERLANRIKLGAKYRQLKKDPSLPFDITDDWILKKIQRGHCEATGIEFDLSLGHHHRPFAPSIDKIDPAKPYVESNCQIVCFIYNAAKGGGSHDDVVKLASAVCNSR
jgi:hypothetical protein